MEQLAQKYPSVLKIIKKALGIEFRNERKIKLNQIYSNFVSF